MYPDFIGIGAQKAGTTWLYRNLQPHPKIWIPRKEVHYFDQKIRQASSFSLRSRFFGKSSEDVRWRRQVRHWTKAHLKDRSLSGLLWTYKYYMKKPGDRWYASLFEPKKGRIAGEITPAYSMLNDEMVAHVHGLMPEARIIFMVRNPIERAWSQAVMYFDKEEKGAAKSVSEEEFLGRFARRDTHLLTDYLRTLENWGSFYQEEQIFVGFLEDVNFHPDELLGSVYSFLGVDPSFKPHSAKRKIHSRSADTMPTRLAAHLAGVYREEIERLEERFGGYASFWNYCARRLIEDPPEEERITYPFWDSSLWEDWTNELPADREAGLHSGVLSSVEVAK
jgi:hypothetical protein